MTVCIAAIVEERAIVLASDRMITLGDIEYEFQDKVKMVTIVPKRVYAMTAGAIDDALEICRLTARAVKEVEIDDIHSIASICADQFQAFRRHRSARLFLEPYGLNHQSFITQQSGMESAFRYDLQSRLEGHCIDGDILIAGVNPSGQAHIFTVKNPGVECCWDAGGFVAIGSGADMAELTFVLSDYTSARPMVEGLWIAYLAKRRAEDARGVGKTTDLAILSKDGLKQYEPLHSIQRMMARMYDRRKSASASAFRTDVTKIEKWLAEADS